MSGDLNGAARAPEPTPWSQVEAQLRPYVSAKVRAAFLERNPSIPEEQMVVIDEMAWAGAVSALAFLVANPWLVREMASELEGE